MPFAHERKLKGRGQVQGGRSPRKFDVGGMDVVISPHQYFNKNYNSSVNLID
jgi:hypothetical protein